MDLPRPLHLGLGHAEGTPSPNWTRQQRTPGSSTWGFPVERVTRIELALSAWEADVLPLNYTRVRRRPSRCPNVRSLYLMTDPGAQAVGFVCVSGGGSGCGGPELGRTVAGWERRRAGAECRLEVRPLDPVMWLLSSRQQARRGSWGRDLRDLIERTVVRCAEGHVFSTASFPMQQAERLGPGRLVRCPKCARLRSAVPVALEALTSAPRALDFRRSD